MILFLWKVAVLMLEVLPAAFVAQSVVLSVVDGLTAYSCESR